MTEQPKAKDPDGMDLPPIPIPRERPGPVDGRENVRARLAFGLLGLLATVILLLVASMVSGLSKWADVENVAELVVAPLVGLTGTAVGFYFGQDNERPRRG